MAFQVDYMVLGISLFSDTTSFQYLSWPIRWTKSTPQYLDLYLTHQPNWTKNHKSRDSGFRQSYSPDHVLGRPYLVDGTGKLKFFLSWWCILVFPAAWNSVIGDHQGGVKFHEKAFFWPTCRTQKPAEGCLAYPYPGWNTFLSAWRGMAGFFAGKTETVYRWWGPKFLNIRLCHPGTGFILFTLI